MERTLLNQPSRTTFRTGGKFSKPGDSRYQSLLVWFSFVMGMLSLGMIWQRSALIPLQISESEPSLNSLLLTSGASLPPISFTYFPHPMDIASYASPLVLGASTYQLTGNPLLGILSSGSLFLSPSVDAQSLPAVIDFNQTLPMSQGFMLQGGNAFDNAGYSVSTAGDVNGDGGVDILVGAYQASPSGRIQAGAVYVIYGLLRSLTTVSATTLTTTELSPTPAGTTASFALITSNFSDGTTLMSGTSKTTFLTTRATTTASTPPSLSATVLETGTTTSLFTSIVSQSVNKTPQAVSNATSTNSLPIIIVAVVGGVSVAACLGAIGFYAYRKKSHAAQSNNEFLENRTL